MSAPYKCPPRATRHVVDDGRVGRTVEGGRTTRVRTQNVLRRFGSQLVGRPGVRVVVWSEDDRQRRAGGVDPGLLASRSGEPRRALLAMSASPSLACGPPKPWETHQAAASSHDVSIPKMRSAFIEGARRGFA
jgi:hypothetical protein